MNIAKTAFIHFYMAIIILTKARSKLGLNHSEKMSQLDFYALRCFLLFTTEEPECKILDAK